MTRNEVRELEDLNPIDGLDDPLVPLNMRGVNDPVESETETNEAFVEDIANRIHKAEVRCISARADKALKDREKFNDWVENKYNTKIFEYVQKAVDPLGKANDTVFDITDSGCKSIVESDNPVEFLKTWQRKDEIVQLINEGI